MYHPTTRVLTVLELLQSRAELSGVELAERLEVDVRTVRRYVSMLQELGIPVQSRRGRYGAYRLRPGYKLPPLMFSGDEAVAVVLGLVVAQRLGFSLTTPAVESAAAKIERVLPVGLRERVQALHETLVLDLSMEGEPAQGEMLLTMGTATRQQRRVWLRYQAWDGEASERLFDPYGMVLRAGRWYAAGYCHLRQDIRVFRLDRVLAVELRPEQFTRPDDFDALTEVTRAIGRTPGAWRCLVHLNMPLDEARTRISPALGTLEETAGGVLLRCEAQSLEWFAHFLIDLPCTFTVQEPPELRDTLRTIGEQVLAAAAPPAYPAHAAHATNTAHTTTG